MNDTLWVYVGDVRAGRLQRIDTRFSFTYDAEDAPALSVRLPSRNEPYGDSDCRPFFSNLLPEGDWRRSLCRTLGIAVDDDFSLLGAIGVDCAGAIAVTADPAWKPKKGRYVPTTESDLRKWVKNPASRPRLAVTPGLRLSLAGAQDKLLIHLDGGKPYLCESGAPSTVIVKPSIDDRRSGIELSALNELASMALARLSQLRVPRSFWFASAYAVERFDRAAGRDRIRRVHQEDFAQILGLSPSSKYDVTWKQCFDLLSTYTTTPASARVELLDRLLYNLVLGNNDAHAKNFAVLHGATGITELSPAYDLLCTQMYRALSPRLAMPIGSAVSLTDMKTSAWRAFAREVQIGFPLLRQRGVELSERVQDTVGDLSSVVVRDNPALSRDVYPARRRADFFARFSKVVRKNCRLLARSLA